jgi:hypothetical protein
MFAFPYRDKMAIPAVMWITVCGLAAVAGACGAQPTALVVNQQQVSQGEFRWFMEQERGGVFRHFAGHPVDDGRDFWSEQIEGTIPRTLLRSNTVARVVREKVEQILFQELGLVEDISYGAFLAKLDKINQEREQAARERRVVYGPVRYTQLQFYQHWKATLRVQARDRLAERRWPPKEEDLRKYYDDKRALFRASPSYTLEVVDVQARRQPTAEKGGALVRAAADQIRSRLQAGGSLTNLLSTPLQDEAVKASGQQFEDMNADRLGELFPDDQQLKAVLALGPGETNLLPGSEGQVRVVRCVKKTPESYRSYQAAQPQVRDRWLAQRYDRHIEQLVAEARISVNQTTLDALLP